jgi:hypothetical protein
MVNNIIIIILFNKYIFFSIGFSIMDNSVFTIALYILNEVLKDYLEVIETAVFYIGLATI